MRLTTALILPLLSVSLHAQAPRVRPAVRSTPTSGVSTAIRQAGSTSRPTYGYGPSILTFRPIPLPGRQTPLPRVSEKSFTEKSDSASLPEIESTPLQPPADDLPLPDAVISHEQTIDGNITDDSEPSDKNQPPVGRELDSTVYRHARSRGFVFAPTSQAAVEPAAKNSASLSVADNKGSVEKAAEVPTPESKHARKTAFSFLANMLTMQLGLEAMAWAVPQMAKALWDSFLSVSLISVVSMSALMLGSFRAGADIDKDGAWKVYRKAALLRTVSATTLAGLYLAGYVGYPALLLLFGLDYYFHGRGRTGESALGSGLYRSDPQRTQRFITIKQIVIDGVGILGPLAAAWAFGWSGFTAIIIAYPILLGLSLLSLQMGPKPEHVPTQIKPTISLSEAIKEIRAKPSLLAGSAAFAFLYAVMFGIYLIVAQSFGLFVNPAESSGILAVTTSLYAAGGFIGTLVALAMDAKRDKKLDQLPEDQKRVEGRRKLLKAAAFWTLLAAAGTALGIWSFLGTTPLLLGIYPAYLAMPLFGFATTVASVQVESLITSEAPQEHAGRLLGVIRAASMAVTIMGFLLLGGVFEYFSTWAAGVKVPLPMAFVALGTVATAIGAVYVWAARVLRKAAASA